VAAHFDDLERILSGSVTIRLYLECLYRNNRTDLLILKNTKVMHLIYDPLFRLTIIVRVHWIHVAPCIILQ
jgi:hypothetical protein